MAKNKNKKPPQAAPIDYGAIMLQATEAANAQYNNQIAAQIASYPQMEGLQLGTIKKIADNLRNDYTARADTALADATANAGRLTLAGDRIGALAGQTDSISADARAFAAGPTALDQQIARLGANAMDQRADQVATQAIESNPAETALMREAQGFGLLGTLEQQAATDLGLGRSLSPEQQREAQQSARAGMSARGLGTGNSALAAEILNRERYATQRENERRTFASSVLGQGSTIRQAAGDLTLRRQDSNANRLLQTNLANQEVNQRQVEYNRNFLQNANTSGINSAVTRGNYALTALGQSANLYGQQAGVFQNAATLGQNLAAAQLAADPYQRAFAPGTTIGGETLQTGANMLGNTFSDATQMAGNVASFNANMLDSRYNAYMNNQAALRGAAMQAGATAGASQNSMLGSGMAAGGMVLGMTALAI